MLVLFYIQLSPKNARKPLHVQALIKYKLHEKCAKIIFVLALAWKARTEIIRRSSNRLNLEPLRCSNCRRKFAGASLRSAAFSISHRRRNWFLYPYYP